MSQSDASPEEEPRSTLYVVRSIILAAVVLGLTFFLLVRGFQWRSALADLRAEPGIEILSVERVGFFKKRILGLRDPLAPTAESLLLKHNIGPHTSEVVLTEYHSLNTPYAKARANTNEEQLRDVRDSLVASLGEFAKSLNEKREADLEKITQMLFEARFPEAMKSVDIKWRDGAWYAEGELYAPERKSFVDAAPDYIIEGDLHFSTLVDLTETKTSSLRKKIESSNLLETDIDGNFVHVERMKRLVADYDVICERSGLPTPALRLEIASSDPKKNQEIIRSIEKLILSGEEISRDRFLPEITIPYLGDTPSLTLKLVSDPAS